MRPTLFAVAEITFKEPVSTEWLEDFQDNCEYMTSWEEPLECSGLSYQENTLYVITTLANEWGKLTINTEECKVLENYVMEKFPKDYIPNSIYLALGYW